jgi:nicotinic acid phosphoribosyltransferase
MSSTYLSYGIRMRDRIDALLRLEGAQFPSNYASFMKLDHWTRKLIGTNFPLVLADNYEHFMAALPHRRYAAHHVLIRKQIGGFTVAAGFWKWLEFLSHQITRQEVELAAEFYSGHHNNHPRQFNKNYWLHVVDDFNGYLPVRIEVVGEGATFTGVPFPVAQVYGETPAVWLNEPMYIQLGHLTHVATIAAQFASILGDPWRFIEVMFRALHNREESDDVTLAMLIGGGIISTSNDLAAFINGAPFKSAGTTGHCWYQQWPTMRDGLRTLLKSPLGPYSTVLLDLVSHEQGFKDLLHLIQEEGLHPPFADRPDSGDTLKLGMHDLRALEDKGHQINVVFEDGKRPGDMLTAERTRKMMGLKAERAIYGAGSAFLGQRRDLEPAYKACHFHDGIVQAPDNRTDTMKICLDDPMKQSVPGLVDCFFSNDSGFYMLGEQGEQAPAGYAPSYTVLYDGLSNPGVPYFSPDYDPQSLATCAAVQNGVERSRTTREKLGPSFTLDVTPNRVAVGMTKKLRDKRKRLHEEAKVQVSD